MALDAVPPGGGVKNVLAFLTDKTAIIDGAKKATAWVEEAIAVVKTAKDNPWGNDDEAIAGEILRQIEEKKAAHSPRV